MFYNSVGLQKILQKFYLYFHPARSKEIMTDREIGSHLVLFPSLLWRAKKIYASQRRLLEETRRRKIFPRFCAKLFEKCPCWIIWYYLLS